MWKHLEVELDYLVRRATFCGWQIAPRRISNYELVYVLRGQGDICLGSRQFTVRTGDLVCFCPGVLHSLSVARQPCMEFYGVHFTLPSGVDRLPLPEVAKIEPPGRLEPLFKSLFEIYKQKTYLYQWRQNLLLEQILCEILSALHGENAPAELIRIKKVLEHIHEDPARPFTLEDLTARSGVKKTLFLQSFRRMTGTTPKQYILGCGWNMRGICCWKQTSPSRRWPNAAAFPIPFISAAASKTISALRPGNIERNTLRFQKANLRMFFANFSKEYAQFFLYSEGSVPPAGETRKKQGGHNYGKNQIGYHRRGKHGHLSH